MIAVAGLQGGANREVVDEFMPTGAVPAGRGTVRYRMQGQ